MNKKDLLNHWRELTPNQDPLSVMTPIDGKQKGKTYGLDGVRIDGSMEFIDAVLSCLKPLLDGENCITRLQASHNDCSKAEGDFNKGNGGNVCYVRLRTRTAEGAASSAFFDRDLHQATERFAALHGVVED